MKIILTKDVPDLGQAGDIKDVAPGYARNYLIRRGLAKRATPGMLRELEQQQAAAARREAKMAARAQELARKLSQITLVFEAKASDKGRLFGSITTADIAAALEREVGEKFDRRKHIISEPLRLVGEHVVTVRLSPEVVVDVKAVVRPEGGASAEAEAASEAAAEEG